MLSALPSLVCGSDGSIPSTYSPDHVPLLICGASHHRGYQMKEGIKFLALPVRPNNIPGSVNLDFYLDLGKIKFQPIY
ncbi:unnamed protein product [Urochloa humidicola]